MIYQNSRNSMNPLCSTVLVPETETIAYIYWVLLLKQIVSGNLMYMLQTIELIPKKLIKTALQLKFL